MADKNMSDELAELAEAVRELRDREVADEIRALRAEIERLRAERAVHHCHGCTCAHIHWHPYAWTIPGTVTYPNYVVTCGSSTANVSAGLPTSTVTTTNVAAASALGIGN
jgi:uncharacterized small protein (DUF1192 family)